MAQGKKFILDLPLKVILTEQGTSYFIAHKQKLLRFKLADNVEEYGISMNQFSPQSIQNMMMVDYISKIEISKSEFVSSRQEVMDLSKVVVYSLLYKQFDREIFNLLIKTECVRKFNRSHPANLIDERTNIPDSQLRSLLTSKANVVTEARKFILDPIWAAIMKDKNYSPEERNVYLLMTEKLMNRLSLMNWFIILKFYKQDGFDEMTSILRKQLTAYMEKSKVAEYISILVMELALNSENSNMHKEAKILYPGANDINALIFDPEIRAKIIDELVKKHELVFLSWKLGGGSSSIGKQGKLQITLYNKADEFDVFKENIDSKSSADLNKRSLVDFYREIPEGEGATDLGLYYLSYLDDACKKVGVKFESIVNQFEASGLTVINLVFNF